MTILLKHPHFRCCLAVLLTLMSVPILRAQSPGIQVPVEIVISVAEQRLVLAQGGVILKKYPISTSRFGLGDGFNSYRTPTGHLKVWSKLGDNLPEGAVIKNRRPTGEVLAANAPGRDPIVTRILCLEGTESSNQNARSRGIYIHGSPEERRIGKPVSYGCIRMRSKDVVEIYSSVPVDTPVTIVSGGLPRLRKTQSARNDVLVADNRSAQNRIAQR